MAVTGPRAVLFDLDGTLTLPNHDFARIKAEMGLSVDTAILEEMERVAATDPERVRDMARILERHERLAAETAQPRAGAAELVRELRARGIGVAVVSRNARRFVSRTLERIGIRVEVVVSREDAEPKPSPEPLRLACHRLGVPPAACWMVGDFLYDVEAGQAAGCGATVLLREPTQRPFAHSATYVIDRLDELVGLIEAASSRRA